MCFRFAGTARRQVLCKASRAVTTDIFPQSLEGWETSPYPESSQFCLQSSFMLQHTGFEWMRCRKGNPSSGEQEVMDEQDGKGGSQLVESQHVLLGFEREGNFFIYLALCLE